MCGAVPPLSRPARLTGTVSGKVQGAWVEACGQRTEVRSDGFYDLMVPAGRPCELVAARKASDGWSVATQGTMVTLQDHEARTVNLALPEVDVPR